MITRRVPVLVLASLAILSTAAPVAASNLIDATYGAGVGSFEVGSFAPIGSDNFNFQSLLGGSTTINGWLVGGVGVDWLNKPNYGASAGMHAVDLGYYDGGAGSISIVLPTVIGATYALSFDAAAVPGFSTYNNAGMVSAGDLTVGFAPTYSAINDFANQVFHAQNFSFVAMSSNTTLSFAASVLGTAYGPVIDNVNVSLSALPVPEPAAAWLLLAGLVAMPTFRRLPARRQ
ncbi:DUF642 domain-containing protein [Roseateles albus]|uniref:DUF642 domain-containing protein n=1 Tax=Roseateles albus TaxID=2987525 RepID=A0ABT5KFC2_9BURK|nr:DUF642 domain-containing protein [Roseateles albus]MDC8772631.1 DUF642 domain-containing protein [Roseateles albus]